MRKSGARTLLIGGQACVLYGATEFSRDIDFLILADAENLDRLKLALDELEAERIAVPELAEHHLAAGLAVHFRCRRADVAGLRVDVMSRLRYQASFEEMWARRTTLETDQGEVEVLSIRDLVQAKKTQRTKDWPMVERLVQVDYFECADPAEDDVRFWCRELRSPGLLIELASRYPEIAGSEARRAVAVAFTGDSGLVRQALAEEQEAEMAKDEAYWKPLQKRLEHLRRTRRSLPQE